VAALQGKVIGDRFQIVNFLGMGGMGVVFKALDLQSRDIVALKLLNRMGVLDPRVRMSLVREARTTAQLRHPNIVQVRDIGPQWQSQLALTGEQLTEALDMLRAQGYRPVHISSYDSGGLPKYAAIFEKRAGPPWIVKFGLNRYEWSQTFDRFKQNGYRAVDVSSYVNADGVLNYAAIFREWNGEHWAVWTRLTAADLQQKLTVFQERGSNAGVPLRPEELSGYSLGDETFYDAVWEQNKPENR
jgi:hypothetical protein